MRIIIFGASGKTGQELVRQALMLGHQVSAFARPTSQIDRTDTQVQWRLGQLTDHDLLVHAIHESDVVFSALGAANPMKYDPLVVEGMRNVCNAMKQAGRSRLVYLSPIAMPESRAEAGFFMHHIAPVLLRTEIRGHTEREKIIRESNLAWTILRAPFLTMGPHTSRFMTGSNLVYRGFLPKLSRADVADAMLRQMEDPNSIRNVIRVLPER